jgi:hypothetical protein
LPLPSSGARARRIPAPRFRSARRRAARLSLLAVPLVAVTLLAGTVQARSASAEPMIYGAIGDKWAQLGGYDFLGHPLDEEHDTFDNVGRTQTFEFGAISWHPLIGAFAVYGDILTKWREYGSEQFGYPVNDETGTPDGVGRYNHFRMIGYGDRSIYWTAETGAQPVWGDFRNLWSGAGWERSVLGYPLTAEFEPEFSSGVVRQNFQGGYLIHVPILGTAVYPYPAATRTKNLVVLRCKYKDSPDEPRDAQYFREFFTQAGRGKGGYADFIENQSYGRTAITGTVKGWYDMGITVAEAKAFPGHSEARNRRFAACVDAAAAGGYRAPAGSAVVTVVNERIDGWGGSGRTFLDKDGLFPNFAFQELSHGIGIDEHSFSDDTSVMRGGAPGEYDDEWDEMSSQHSRTVPSKYFGKAAMSFNALNRQKIGAFTANDVRTVTPTAGTDRTYEVEALETPQTTSPEMLKVNADGRVFWVEYRSRTQYSAAMTTPTIVLIHELIGNTGYLLRSHSGSRDPLQTVTAGNVTISVARQGTTTASIRVQAT